MTDQFRRKCCAYTGLILVDQTEITAGLVEGDQIVKSLDRAGVKAGVKVQPEAAKAGK